MPTLFEPSALCTVCLARATDSERYEAALAWLMRRELDRRGFARHLKLSDAELVRDPSRYFAGPRKDAEITLRALARLAQPKPTNPPF